MRVVKYIYRDQLGLFTESTHCREVTEGVKFTSAGEADGDRSGAALRGNVGETAADREQLGSS